MKKISIKGIVLGVIATIGLDTVAGVVLVLIFGGHLFKSGITNQQLEEAMTVVAQGNNFLISSLIIGTLTTVLGGYIAARVARKEVYLNSGIVGLFGIFSGVFLAGGYPIWFNVAAFLTVVPAALTGGHLAKSKVP